MRETQMKARIRNNYILCAVLISMLILIFGCKEKSKAPPPPPKPPFSFITATNLFDVDCVDKDNIYIIGFNSTILHTADGGKTWQFQKSGTTLNLCDVSFINTTTGWISG